MFLTHTAGNSFLLNEAGVFLHEADGYSDTQRDVAWVAEIEAGTRADVDRRARARS